jgi:hypothetical protein
MFVAPISDGNGGLMLFQYADGPLFGGSVLLHRKSIDFGPKPNSDLAKCRGTISSHRVGSEALKESIASAPSRTPNSNS